MKVLEKAREFQKNIYFCFIAAQIATEAGIDTYVCSGEKPENLYKILEGKQVGTLFKSK